MTVHTPEANGRRRGTIPVTISVRKVLLTVMAALKMLAGRLVARALGVLALWSYFSA